MARHFGGSLRDVLDNRWASASGGLGLLLSTLACAGLIALAGPSAEAAASDDELRFVPGTIAKLGTPDASDGGDGSRAPVSSPSTPASQPEPTTPAVEPTQPNRVTTDPSLPQRPPRKPRGGGASLPRPSGGGSLPGPSAPRGVPWGSDGGWDELTRDGDPWATEVMKRLNAMVVRPFGGDPGAGVVRFQLTVCKDGERTKITRKGGDAKPTTHDAVAIAVEQLELPPIPARLVSSMTAPCMKIRYTFEWEDDRVE